MSANSMNSQQPKHIAVIMDGNGRWARKMGRPRFYGHVKGARAAKDLVKICVQRKVANLTLYAFSNENWFRPKQEIAILMKILDKYLLRERKNLIKNNIKFRCIGERNKLPSHSQKIILACEEDTKYNTGLELIFAISYSGRQELTKASRKIAQALANNDISVDEIDEALLESQLETFPAPSPDLLIRTGGEFRLSNFLPWQTVYTELYFCETLWPDFNEIELQKAFDFFASRERRYGRTEASPISPPI